MTEIDFDELDRAVNSIMAGGTRRTPARPTESNAPSPVTSPIESTPVTDNAASTPVPPEVDEAPTPRPVTRSNEPARSVERPVAPAADRPSAIPVRRGGRFMDVVHPSSNMKPTTTTARSVSRNAATVEPLQGQPHSPNLEELNALLSDAEPSASSEPMTSPFITDAKVEKRPLGGASQSETADTSKQEDESVPADETLRVPAEPEKPVVIPAELTPDLLSIESSASDDSNVETVEVEADDAAEIVPVTKLDTTPAPARTSTVESQEERPAEPRPTPKESSQATAEAPAKKEASAGIGPIAIQQQYTQEPSTSPAESGAIYDTNSYHQPLVHVEKKKSGWMWVVWIVLLLILGAGGGAAAYFLLLQ